MRYATAAVFRTALEQRLLTAARQVGFLLVRLRKLVVFDQLLARLMVVAPNWWILEGAVALHVRLGARFRTTRGMDLGRYDCEPAATADFSAAQAVDLGDHVPFDIRKTTRLDEVLEGAAVRYHVSAEPAGRPFQEVAVDVGFGNPPVENPERLRRPDLLSFAEIAPIAVPTLPLEQHVAEKAHAYSRCYAGGHPGTHAKDLIDLILIISSLFPFQAVRLRSALRTTFDARRTLPLPAARPPAPPGRVVAYRKMAAEVGLQPGVSIGYQQATAFLAPILVGTVSDDAHWNPTRHSW